MDMQYGRTLAALFLAAVVLVPLAVVAQSVYGMPTQGKQVVYQEHYRKIETRYTTVKSTLGTQLVYTVVEAQRAGSVSNASVAMNVTNYVSTVIGEPHSVALSVSSTYDAKNMALNATVRGSNATLLMVGLAQAGVTQIAWAGVVQLNGSASFTCQAYSALNESATLELVFASESGLKLLSVPLNQSATVNLSLPAISFAVKSQLVVESTVITSMPVGYEGYSENSSWVNATAEVHAPLANASMNVFFGQTYPSLYWRGSTVALFNGGQLLTLSSNLTVELYGFYGVNGTLAGFIKISSLEGQHSVALSQLNVSTTVDASTLLVVYAQSLKDLGLTGVSHTYEVSVGGQPVVVASNSSLAVESTATVDFTHQVYVNTTAVLLYLNTWSKTGAYVLVNPKVDSASRVQVATPQSVKATTITVGSTVYQATEVNVSAEGYMVFNVTVDYPSVIVFKATATGVTQLNKSNYWSSNGRVYVFDDPSNTYYVANASSPSQSTTTVQQSTTLATMSNTTQQQTMVTAAVILLIVIVVIVAIALIAMRRR